ncbi:P-type ATPase, N-terminal [Phytophthora cactorum]|nr:P-type ATPase, N-terminal [Phytophthora cactorum]
MGEGTAGHAGDFRVVYLNDAHRNSEAGYCNNFIVTSKYTIASFLPKFLFESFRKLSNLYFLIICILQCIPEISNTNGNPSTLPPLVFIITVDGVFAILEDHKRHQADNIANASPTLVLDRETKKFKQTTWADVVVGTLSKLQTVDWYQPTCSCWRFQGVLELEGKEKASIPYESIILRGCIIRNTEWVHGVVFNTGKDTKIMMSNSAPPSKMSSMDRSINQYTVVLLAILVIFNDRVRQQPFVDWLIMWFYYLLLMYQFVPISLAVSMSMVKYLQAQFIQWDINIYHPDTDTPTLVRSMSLNEELGQISYIFSDKTGTLTCNVMEFRNAQLAEFHTTSQSKGPKVPYVNFDGPELFNDMKGNSGSVQQGRMTRFSRTSRTRKRMSTIIRHPNGRIFLYSKGADVIIYGLLEKDSEEESTSSQLQEITRRHIDQYAEDGLRTLTIAVREIDPSYYFEWATRFHDAQNNLNEIDKRKKDLPNEIDACMNEIECDLELLGATAIEDKLQSGVPDAIANLACAGIKIWVLTGDKEETAINIGFACQLVTNEMKLFVINAKNAPTAEILESTLRDEIGVRSGDVTVYIASPPSTRGELRELALVIDGETLMFGLRGSCRPLLAEFSQYCKAVIACRVSPAQKAEMVALIKEYVPGVRTLAIGDGANDVSMIQEAHIGVGISGQEGMQAVNSSDYAIAQFRFLQRLLLVHGRWNYRRMAQLVLYIFYKNILFTAAQYWYTLLCGFSGQKFFLESGTQLYNIALTAIPIVAASILDQDVSDDVAMTFPKLYFTGPRDEDINTRIFSLWVVGAIVESVIITFITLHSLQNAGYGGASPTMWLEGFLVFTLVVSIANSKLFMFQNSFHFFNYILYLGSVLMWLLVALVCSHIYFLSDLTWEFMLEQAFALPSFWLVYLFVPVAALSYAHLLNGIKSTFFPEYWHLAKEVIKFNLDRKLLQWNDNSNASVAVPARLPHAKKSAKKIGSIIPTNGRTQQHRTTLQKAYHGFAFSKDGRVDELKSEVMRTAVSQPREAAQVPGKAKSLHCVGDFCVVILLLLTPDIFQSRGFRCLLQRLGIFIYGSGHSPHALLLARAPHHQPFIQAVEVVSHFPIPVLTQLLKIGLLILRAAKPPSEKLEGRQLMLRVSNLLRGLTAAPLRRRTILNRSSVRAFSVQGGGDEDDDDGLELEGLELDWDDLDDMGDDWELDDEGDVASAGRRKVEEHVKQKVSVRRAKHSKRRFVDRIRVKATGGHGGNGCASFFSESAMRKRPNGGHGGAGGDVVIETSDKMQNLANATHHFKGGSGTNGMPNDAAGRRGKHCHVKVPCGTLVKRVERYERELEDGEYEIVDRMEVVADLDKPGATFLAAKGGKPGLGNRILAGKTTKFGRLRKHMPESKTTGSPGTSQYYELELKRSPMWVSWDTPTLAMGIVEFPDTFRLSVADIPGLIDGATAMLALVTTSCATLSAQRNLVAPSLIVANKMDGQGAEDNFHKLRQSTDLAVLPVSFACSESQTQEIVAVKKIKALFPTWEECLQLRELKSLRVLRHENIVLLKEVIRDKEELYFVFEYLQTSLFRVMRNFKSHGASSSYTGVGSDTSASSDPSTSSSPPHPWFSEVQIRSIMFQLFSGLAYMHKHGFFHRDIKPENLLCHDDTLKIADLGQAREIRSRPPFTDYVATRWYRAPELLLRSTTYNSPIDMWACGCILVELLICTPLFPGTSEADQFYRICKVLGTPTKETRRITAAQALQHRFFDQAVPRPRLTIPPLVMPVEEVPVLPLRGDYKAVGGYSSYAARSSICAKKSDDVETSGYWAGGGLSSRQEHHLWTAKERQQTHSRHQEWGSSLVSARPGGYDDVKAVPPIQNGGGVFKGGSVRKSSSFNALVSEGDSTYSTRKLTSEDNSEYDDETKSDGTLLQDLLDEILG